MQKQDRTINLKMTISYDGSNYAGWQRLGKESSERSIQGILETMLGKVFTGSFIDGKKYEVIGSGRTDAGVHAIAQVGNVHIPAWEVGKYSPSDMSEKLKRIRKNMNENLPVDIRIQKLELVSDKFHSRYSAVSKIYEYTIDTREKADVFMRKYTLSFSKPLNMERMREGSAYFVGTHDFRAFSSKMKDGRSTICTIEWIKIEKEENFIKIQIKGDGFLYHMVRIMVGTLLLVGIGERKPEEIKTILESKDRMQTGPKADSQGLCLKEVFYKEENNKK